MITTTTPNPSGKPGELQLQPNLFIQLAYEPKR
jgi:hypothetical protein